MCIENGRPDGSQRAAQVIAAVDGWPVLSPADFRPEKTPPHFVAAKLVLERRDDKKHAAANHAWDVALFQMNTTISISIRVAK